jgi:hypothetical protein
MMKHLFLLNALVSGYFLSAQQHKITGVVLDSLTNQPIYNATITLNPGVRTEVTDELGRFEFHDIQISECHITVTTIGFEEKNLTISSNDGLQKILLAQRQTTLAEIVITASQNSPYKALMESDMAMRGITNSQEVLRMVPGLIIGQHQGGGKAEQIFLRGFDADHGTDISIHADGIPVNMVSHAHAQGYADSHFIIPETIEQAVFNKGPYDIQKGDFATAGYLDFSTIRTLKHNVVKLEGGQFQTFRALAMFDLLGNSAPGKKAFWYAASEFNYSNGYFENPQHFKRFNFFTKYTCDLSDRQMLTVTLSTLRSQWRASGQIPERAIDSGLVTYYGTLDPNEGGNTSRTNVNVQVRTALPNGGVLKNQIYYTKYTFDLHSNFTFFLDDPVNGDAIKQWESRNLAGYNGSFIKTYAIGGIKATTLVGMDLRLDLTNNTGLAHTQDRNSVLNPEKLGDIAELGSGVYINETLKLSEKWRLKGGLRYDQFFYRYKNRLPDDAMLKGAGVYNASNHIVSPKINLLYQASPKAQYYLSLGKGFHTNDARVVITENGNQTLPAAYSTDLGAIYKPAPNLLVHGAVWHLYLQKEYVYAGDGGTVEFSGRTRRFGIDVSIRYQLTPYLFLDADVDCVHGRSLEEQKGLNYIPLAPVWSSAAGLTGSFQAWNASLRYRYLSKRPANADYSLTCDPYFVNDLVIRRRGTRFEYGVIIYNLFNVKWKETEFETITRFKNEEAGVNGISFTPGTPFAAKVSFSYFFGFRNAQRKP